MTVWITVCKTEQKAFLFKRTIKEQCSTLILVKERKHDIRGQKFYSWDVLHSKRREPNLAFSFFFWTHTKKPLMQQVSACSLLLGGGYFGKCQKLLTEAESRQKRVKKKEVTLNYWTEQENSWKHCCRVSPPWTTDKESKDTGWFIMNRLWGHFLICDFRLDIYIHTHIYIKLTSLDLIEDNVKISVGELTLGPKKRADCLRLSTHCVPENERGPGGRWGRWSCPLQHTVLLQTDTHRKDIKVIFQSDNAPKG